MQSSSVAVVREAHKPQVVALAVEQADIPLAGLIFQTQ
jgi:hypothetical protein